MWQVWQMWHVAMKKSNKKSPFKGDLEGLESRGDLEGLRQSVFAFCAVLFARLKKKQYLCGGFPTLTLLQRYGKDSQFSD